MSGLNTDRCTLAHWTVPHCHIVPVNCRFANGGLISETGKTSIMETDGAEEERLSATGATVVSGNGCASCSFMESFMKGF